MLHLIPAAILSWVPIGTVYVQVSTEMRKKWNAAVFIISHHQLFTTLFTGPKKHFTCRRQGGNPSCWVLSADSVICAQTACHVNGVKNMEKCSGWLFIRSHRTLVNPKNKHVLMPFKTFEVAAYCDLDGPHLCGRGSEQDVSSSHILMQMRRI